MKLSIEELPRSAKLSLQRPFHFFKCKLLGSLFQDDGTADDLEFNVGIWAQTESVPNFFGDGYLAAFADFHTFKYD